MAAVPGFHQGPEYELVSNAQAPDGHSEDQSTYKAVQGQGHAEIQFQRPRGLHHGLASFVSHSPVMIAACCTGLCLTLACFAFTYWLSRQIFTCPAWSVDCDVNSSVRYFVTNLNQVQGVLSTIFGIGISMIAYATFELAETTLWPTLTSRPLQLQEIDRFITAFRGSLATSTRALVQARGFQNTAVVLTVGIIALLLQVNSTIVGYAFKLVDMPTELHSNHTIGGGFGFSFSQANPPPSVPGAVGNAQNVYAAWSNGWSEEPMPEQRDFIVDRSNISTIGDVSINAVEAHKKINCSGMPINITGTFNAYNYDPQMVISTNHMGDVYVRVQPRLTLWVDDYNSRSLLNGYSRLVFAVLNGTIEGGTYTPPTDYMKELDYTSISSLACDVDVTLSDSKFCTGRCQQEYSTLSSIESLNSPGTDKFTIPRDLTTIAIWLAVAVDTYGTSVSGAQPMFSPGTPSNHTQPLPVAYTTDGVSGDAFHWSQAELINFIQVGSGALGMIMTHSWELNVTGNVTVVSSLEMSRMDTSRSFLLLIPIGLVLLSLIMLAAIIEIMYRRTGVDVVRLGSVGEIIIASQTSDVNAAVRDLKEGRMDRTQFSETKYRYGVLPDGSDGLGRRDHVSPFLRNRY